MKRFGIAVFTMGLLLSAAGGCGGGGANGGDGTTIENIFYTAAKNTTPVFTPESAGAMVTKGTWSFGSVNYELFNMLREYINSRDEGTIGLDNIYKVLYQGSQFYTNAQTTCETLPAETTIESPFNFGNTVTYTCAGNDTADKHGNAIKETEGTQYGLLSWQVLNYDENNSDEMGVIQGNYNETTGAVDIDMAVYVNYVAQNDFSVRTEISGNDQTHEFTLRLMKYTAGGYSISVVGSGVSQGEGNYFLFKVTDDNVAGKYYCYNASADEAALEIADDAGSDTVDPNCAAYQSAVDALTLFVSTDLPDEASDFNTGNPQEGTIYLNY